MEYTIFKTDNETNTTTEVNIHVAASNLTAEEVVKLIKQKELSTDTHKFTVEVTKQSKLLSEYVVELDETPEEENGDFFIVGEYETLSE